MLKQNNRHSAIQINGKWGVIDKDLLYVWVPMESKNLAKQWAFRLNGGLHLEDRQWAKAPERKLLGFYVELEGYGPMVVTAETMPKARYQCFKGAKQADIDARFERITSWKAPEFDGLDLGGEVKSEDHARSLL